MANVLITGGAGFIGAHTAKKLWEQGHSVVLFDSLDNYVYPSDFKERRIAALFPNEAQRPQLIVGDILDKAALNGAFKDMKFDTVLHFAALANPGKSMDASTEYTQVNVQGTINVLDVCREHGIGQFIFAGSSSVYNDQQTPFREDSYPLQPRSPYGASKAAAEVYIRMWHDLYNIPTTILRFFSVYGSWGRPDMAPSVFSEKILKGEPIEVTKDRRRDFTYIDDIVSGVVAASEKKLDFEIMNIGGGQPHDLMDFIKAVETAAGKEANMTMREAPPGEMRETYADTSKAKELLGYEPKVPLEEGVKNLVEWMKTEIA